MKIVQICPRYYPDIGGVETHVQEISERLVTRGFDVDVLCTDPTGLLPKDEIINGVKVKRFKSFAPDDAYYFSPQIYYYLKSMDYDLVHAHSYHAMPSLFASLANYKNPFVFTPHYHGSGHTFIRNLLHKPYKIFGSKIFEKANKVICVSGYERRMVMSDFNLSAEKIEIIPNGINLNLFEKFKNTKKNEIKTLLYVGRLEEYKGIQYIIKSLPHLIEYKLEIVGKGPYENELHKLAEQLSVSKRIDWYENMSRNELLEHYSSSDVFLMLSSHEAYGITVAEALASGTPSIVASGSALDEFVDGVNCMGIEMPITTDKLVKTIDRLINVISKEGMDIKALPIYDWNVVTDKLIEVYKGLE